jgi:UDP-N-acetylmuramate: L-alanyl-gamma-D-glutamyl-meso-diaminopimelate ligase
VRSLNQELGQVLTYGREGSGADYEIRQVKVESEVVFEVWHEGASVETLILSLTGEHNALNALSVWIELHRVLGIPSAQVVEALREFRGVKRRQEVRGEIDGRVVIDDFAHHPTAIRETLLALRMKFPGKKILVAFEPRSATSRRKVFQTEFAESLSTAQGVAVSVPYDPSKIPESERFSSSELVRNLRDQGVESWEFDPEAPHATFGRIRSSTQPGDVIAVFSNGGFSGFIPKILANWGDGVQP